MVPTSSALQPGRGAVLPTPLTVSDLAEEAPPYSSAAGVSPNAALSSSTGTANRGDADDNNTSPFPPPPYEIQGGEESQDTHEDRRMRQLREAMDGMMRA